MTSHTPPSVHKMWTLLAVCLGTFMLLLDITIVVVASPSIRESLHTGFSDVQWTIDAYSLSLAAVLLPAGSLGDILGRRRMFAIGLGVFSLGSLLCAISTSGAELIACRAFQGIGGATIFATSLALLAQTFHGRERGMAFGVWGAVTAVSSALGPLLGGLLTSELSWRWIFYVNLPVGVFAIFVTLAFIREHREARARRVDVPGFAIFTLGLVALVYGLIESGRAGWGDTKVVIALAVGAASLAAFPVVEHLVPHPMFDLKLFRKPTFVGGSIAAFGMNGSLFAMFLYLILYLQNALHISPLHSGLRLAIITGCAFVTAVPAGKMSDRLPVRWLVGPGLLIVGGGLLLMRGLDPASSWTHLIPGFAVAGLGTGLVNAPLAQTAVGVVHPKDAGMASGINSTFRQVGISTAVAALGTVFASKLKHVTAATVPGTYASAMNELLLIAAVVALSAGVLAIVLIRPKDFVHHQPVNDWQADQATAAASAA